MAVIDTTLKITLMLSELNIRSFVCSLIPFVYLYKNFIEGETASRFLRVKKPLLNCASASSHNI